MDEAELIARSQKGNVAAFNQLVIAHQEIVYNVALRTLGDPDGAADATQDAFISAFKAIASFRGGSFRVWLLRIVTNACYDALRTQKRRPSQSLDGLTGDDDSAVESSLASPTESPEEYVLRRDVQAEIARGLQTLPSDQRIAVVLSDVQGFSYEEIADITKSSLGTVKSRLSRGRARLRDYLVERELYPTVSRL